MTKILVKIPTRERPKQFIDVLASYIRMQDSYVEYIISIDDDDKEMEKVSNNFKLKHIAKTTYVPGKRVSKIEACNRDIKGDWDILVLASDDMIPKVEGWDAVIKKRMEESFPDLDGCLWFSDGHNTSICTMSIMGRKYYDRFGYVYHPSYKSLFCDNEFTEVALSLNKIAIFDECLFEHCHPALRKANWDKLYRHNENFWNEDEANYNKRKNLGFP